MNINIKTNTTLSARLLEDLFEPRILLRLEGLALLAASIALYVHQGYSGWAFLALLFVPDLSAVGYLAGPSLGRIAYNSVHNFLLPFALAAAGSLLHQPLALQVVLVWLAHIGLDRMLGYGLKYRTGFKDTHLERV